MTSPDTNTLNGALEQLGITMAENLVTMGVSDADPSDGLTTLAGKILSISPTPTPTVDSLTLAKTAGKQILSYADSGASPETEYCTVTATALDSNNQGVSGQSVVFKVGTTTVATETTDSNGEASYTYTSQGSGDVVLSAECSSLIQTYDICDAIYYSANEITKTHNSSTYAYLDSNIQLTSIPSHYEVSLDLKTPSSNVSVGFGEYGYTDKYYCELAQLSTSQVRTYTRETGTSNATTYNINSSYNTYNTVKIEVNGSTVKYYFKDTLVATDTANWLSSLSKLTYKYWADNITFYVKNLKIKPL